MVGRNFAHYLILERIGAGGMGVVYKAQDTQLGRPVALKLVGGEAEGETYIAMELVEGRALSSMIATDGLPVETVIRYGTQLADALAHAHDRGIVHRDLKGANVVVTLEGRPKILDFGLARRVIEEAQETTHTMVTAEGAIAGT